jgi:hypothetical protein
MTQDNYDDYDDVPVVAMLHEEEGNPDELVGDYVDDPQIAEEDKER